MATQSSTSVVNGGPRPDTNTSFAGGSSLTTAQVAPYEEVDGSAAVAKPEGALSLALPGQTPEASALPSLSDYIHLQGDRVLRFYVRFSANVVIGTAPILAIWYYTSVIHFGRGHGWNPSIIEVFERLHQWQIVAGVLVGATGKRLINSVLQSLIAWFGAARKANPSSQ